MLAVREISEREAVLDVDACVHDGNCAEFVQHFSQLIEGDHPLITMNLSKLTAINSLTVEHIRVFENMLSQRGKSLQIKGCNSKVLTMLRFLRIDQVVPVS
jgi:anti-anti-sigma regulatory factor